MSESIRPPVAVVGSLNIDYFTRVEVLPTPGATVASRSLELFPGGKGANQSIAASRQGAEVRFIGTVGEDEEGRRYLDRLEDEGVDTSRVDSTEGLTGAAFITVDASGENMIVTAGGANGALTPERIGVHEEAIRGSGALLAQLEVPVEAVVEAARIANEAEVPFLLNPSPIDPTFPWQSIRTDLLIVNEGEAIRILEMSPLEEDPSLIRQRLHELRVETLVVTRGADETLCFTRGEDPFEVETLAVLPIDTVGAGDAFAGCLATWIAAGSTLVEAIRAANCAGALTTLGPGAQDSIPDRENVEQHLEHLHGSYA